ncbi:sphingosine 1-phosphate receptor 3-like [Nematostella vectensis]|uniref:sphingosine 1-phosphate receptor 3-like n=1 Tax=Nematostella vectensis TaxID=45351 RepID=UPI0020772820|nr:sphingosine 1-phosphate receptor 3-like [Nematostella vectensis]
MDGNTSTTTSFPVMAGTFAFCSMGVTLIFLNALTILTFLVHRNLRKRSLFLPLNLCFADMLVGVTSLMYGSELTHFKNPSSLMRHLMSPNSTTTFDNFTATASFAGLTTISMERMHATVWPIRHRNLDNHPYFFVIALKWAFSVALTIILTEFTSVYFSIAMAGVAVGILVISISYILIFVTVKHQNAQFQGHSTLAQKRERQLAKTLFIVTVLSLATWAPDMMWIVYRRTAEKTESLLSVLALDIVLNVVRYLNSLINPCIYVLRMKAFRRAFVKLLCRRNNNLVPLGS